MATLKLLNGMGDGGDVRGGICENGCKGEWEGEVSKGSSCGRNHWLGWKGRSCKGSEAGGCGIDAALMLTKSRPGSSLNHCPKPHLLVDASSERRVHPSYIGGARIGGQWLSSSWVAGGQVRR